MDAIISGSATDVVQAGNVLTIDVLAGAGAHVQRLYNGVALDAEFVTGTRRFGPYLQDITFSVTARPGASVRAYESPQTAQSLNTEQSITAVARCGFPGLVERLRTAWHANVAWLRAAYPPVASVGTVVYIDPTVAGPGAGSLADPYNAPPTISAANTYLFLEGTTYTGVVNFTTGSSGAVVGTYEAGTGARVFEYSRLATINANGAQNAVYRSVATANNITVSGLRIIGARHTSQARGAYFGTGGGSGFIVEYCVFEDIEPTTAATGSCGVQSFANDAHIRFNIFRLKNCDAILFGDNSSVGGENTRIYGNQIHVLPTTDIDGPDGIQGASAHGYKSLYVVSNWIDVSRKNIKQGVILQDTSGGTTGTVAGLVGWNVVLGADTLLTKLGTNNQKGMELGVPNIKVHANAVVNAEYGINGSGASCDYRGNLIVQRSSPTTAAANTRGLSIGGAGSVVEHNTCVVENLISGAIGINAYTSGQTVRQNIVVGPWPIGIARVTSESDNVVFGAASPIANGSFVATSAGSGTTTNLDPLLANMSSPTRPLIAADSTAQGLDRDVFGGHWIGKTGALQ